LNGTRQQPWQFDDAEYTSFRKRLLRRKGSSAQKDFLRQVRDHDEFIAELDKFKVSNASKPALIPHPLTESEYKEPPIDTEQAIYRSWSELVPAAACRSAFWARVTLEHVRHRRIQAVYLAANGGSLPGGAERIDRALADRSGKANVLLDRCVRTILRRLGGLPEVRGNRSVFVDCPFARAWWRERMVSEAAHGNSEIENAVRAAFRINQTYWEKFIDRVVFRNSTFGAFNIRSAFARALGSALATNPTSNLRETKTLQRLCRNATAYQGSRELGIIGDKDLDVIMQKLVENR